MKADCRLEDLTARVNVAALTRVGAAAFALRRVLDAELVDCDRNTDWPLLVQVSDQSGSRFTIFRIKGNTCRIVLVSVTAVVVVIVVTGVVVAMVDNVRKGACESNDRQRDRNVVKFRPRKVSRSIASTRTESGNVRVAFEVNFGAPRAGRTTGSRRHHAKFRQLEQGLKFVEPLSCFAKISEWPFAASIGA